ncbi:MAG TPA: FHA domain-containing protein [Ilumatobacter sp.]|nr:FHA domain-containing protein [Ilumatobacter sp.]
MFPVVVIRQPGCTPIHLQVREPIEVGRECTGVIVSDPRVSRRHLVLAPTDGGGPAEVAVLDLGSMNGTILAGVRLTSEAILRPGNEVRLGDTTVALVLDRDDAVAPVAPVAGDPGATATTVLPSQRSATPSDPWRRPADGHEPSPTWRDVDDWPEEGSRDSWG